MWSSDTLGAGLKTLDFQACKSEEAQELADLREIQVFLALVLLNYYWDIEVLLVASITSSTSCTNIIRQYQYYGHSYLYC